MLAYLFRLQEYVLGGLGALARPLPRRHPELHRRVDDVVAPSSAPRGGRPQIIAVTLLAMAVVLALGPIVGPAYFPDWLPRPLTSYIGGQRPMAHFTLFPGWRGRWSAW